MQNQSNTKVNAVISLTLGSSDLWHCSCFIFQGSTPLASQLGRVFMLKGPAKDRKRRALENALQ
jgi:hypothetical protein